MKFYDCATAPSPRRVRVYIAEKGLADRIETVEIDLRGGAHMTAEFRAINPNCTVPAIEADDGTRFVSTQGCWRYLEAAFPEPPLMGRNPAEIGRVADLEWWADTEGFMAVAEALRNGAPRMKDRALVGPVNYAQIPELAERGRQRVPRFFQRLDELLEGREFLAGDYFSVADITALCVVDFAGWLKLTLSEEAKNARRWYAAVSARPSVAL
jgi:glutathione S-transferase